MTHLRGSHSTKRMNCDIVQNFRDDFSALWQCKIVGGTLEITTPFLLPDSSLLSLFLTDRSGKFVSCDGGTVSELIAENCGMPPAEISSVIDAFKIRFGVTETTRGDGVILYYKSSTEAHLLTSVSFDLANFVLAVLGALVGNYNEESLRDSDPTFGGKANLFLSSLAGAGRTIGFNKEIHTVVGVKFSAVITSESRHWLISYISGSKLPYFRRSTTETIFNFEEVQTSAIRPMIARTIPLINNEAGGYKPLMLTRHFDRLNEITNGATVSWTERDRLAELLA